MKAEIKVPEVGESITEGILVEWHVADGDVVEAEADLFELETDKITMTVQAEEGGKVSISVGEEETVQVGQVVGTIDTDAAGEAPAKESAPAEKSEAKAEEKPAQQEAPAEKAPDPEPSKPTASSEELADLAPAVRRMIEEKGLDPSTIDATGKDGRLTKEDVVRHLESGSTPAPKQEPAKPEASPTPPQPSSAAKQPKVSPTQRQTRKPMSQIRKRIAERLLSAKQDTAMLTTFNEVDMSNLMAMRGRYKDAFEKKYGIKLGIMSFFVKAAVDALKTVPAVNQMIDGDDLIQNNFYDIGIAVSTPRGLMVPVIRDADQLSFADVELTIADYAKRARDGKITLDDLQGGVFTITNGGVFGSMLSTPILNPPQSAILGMHSIKKRPVVVEKDGVDTVEIRQMMYLAMSYDHRVIDGAESVTFLKRIVEVIENPERMLFEI